MTRKNLETIGYIACDPTAGDCASDHEGTIQPTYERARQDIDETRPTVRCVGSDGYLYVDEPEDTDEPEPEPEPEDDDTLVDGSVQLINPWSGAAPEEYCLSWTQIVAWAVDHVHESDRDEWLAIAKTAYDQDDGETLGRMIIGS